MAAVLVAVAGTGLTFGMWWVYFIVPQSRLLHARRELSFRFGYLHLVGVRRDRGNRGRFACRGLLHRAPLEARCRWAPCCASRYPSAIYIAAVYLLYMLLVRTLDAFHVLLVVLTAAVLVAAVLFAEPGMSMANSLLIVMLAPAVTVIGYELLGHRHAEEAVARLRMTGV